MASSLVDFLNENPQDLLVPNDELRKLALKAVKESLDPIASQYSIFDQVHIDGLDAEQVWAQARMVVDGAIEKLLGDVLSRKRVRHDSNSEVGDSDSDLDSDDDDEEDFEELRNQNEANELDSEEEEEELNDDEDEDDEFEVVNKFSDEEDLATIVNDEEDDGNDLELEESDGSTEGEEKSKPESVLDDGLFRLADFQQQILALEKNEEDEDNDEDINYFADVNEQDSESDGDFHYNDFFAPPKKDKKKRTATTNKTSNEDNQFNGLSKESKVDTIEDVMKSARRELFADDDEEEEEGNYGASGKKSGEQLSTFEKQQLELMKQIQQLEEENVAEKSWAVRGEVKARDRPLDSLIETDLDFERNAKPVPVITQEVTESLEDTIRRRIKSEEFDDVPRRLPDTLPEFRRSKLVEVQETKSQKSLAELYEDDYVKNNNPDTYIDATSEKLQLAQKEVVDMYASISRKLDALCSWNYTPKAPKPSISIVTNAPAISMEEAQPTAMATETMLAPQEVYQPGSASSGNKREVVGVNGLPVARAEMSREERKREKRHQKTKRAKMFKEKEEQQKSKAQKEGSKANIMETLKKGNVTIIGKKGEKRDLSGKLVKEKKKAEGSNLKL